MSAAVNWGASSDFDWSQPVAKKEDELVLNWSDEEKDETSDTDLKDEEKVATKKETQKHEQMKNKEDTMKDGEGFYFLPMISPCLSFNHIWSGLLELNL